MSSKLELQVADIEFPAITSVPVVRERAHKQILAGRSGCPLGGYPVSKCLIVVVVPLDVAIGGNKRPRAEVLITRVDLDVLRECPSIPPAVAILTVAAAPGVGVLECEDEIDVVIAIRTVVSVRDEGVTVT